MKMTPHKLFRYDLKPFGKRLEGYVYTDFERGRTRYSYTQEYYERLLSPRQYLVRVILYFVLFLFGVFLFIAAGTPRSAVNATPLIGLSSCLNIFAFLWMAYTLIVTAVYKNKLTVWAFRVSAIQFQLAAICCALLALISAIFTILYATTVDGSTFSRDVLGFILRLVMTGAFTAIAVLEYSTEYHCDLED